MFPKLIGLLKIGKQTARDIYLDILKFVFSKAFVDRSGFIVSLMAFPYVWYFYSIVLPDRRQFHTYLIQRDVEQRVLPSLNNLPNQNYDEFMIYKKYDQFKER